MQKVFKRGSHLGTIDSMTHPVVLDKPVRRPGMARFLIYVAAFHLVWMAWPWLLYPKLTAALGEDTVAYAVVQLTIRVSVWVVPVWLYLRYIDRVEPVEYLKLKRHVGRGLVYALVLTAVNLVGMGSRSDHLGSVRRDSPAGLDGASYSDNRHCGDDLHLRFRHGDRVQVVRFTVDADRDP